MRALLEQEPDYAWGWRELARWERKRGAPEKVLAAARGLEASLPDSPVSHRFLAEALFEVGRRAEGRRALERAADLDPNDAETLVALFETLLDDGDLAAAASLLPVLRAAHPAAALSAETRLFAEEGEGERALEALRALAREPRADRASIEAGLRACAFAGLADRCDALLGDLLRDEAAHPSVGELWARRRVSEDDFAGAAKAMKSLDPTVPAAREAAPRWLALLRERGKGGEAREAARAIKQRFSPCSDALWAEIAASLLGSANAECVTWARDWRERPKATSWMLFIVASALREADEHEEAYEVVRRAAPLPTDGASRSHRAWLAFELALGGDAGGARRWLTAAGDLAGVPILEAVATMTKAVLVAAERARLLTSFGQARALLSQARGGAGPLPAVLSRAHARAARSVAARAGVVGALWLHRRIVQRVAVAAVLVLIVVALASSGSSARGSASGGTAFFPSVLWVPFYFAIRAAMRRGRKA